MLGWVFVNVFITDIEVKYYVTKVNVIVRLRKLFYESLTGVPALLPCSQLPRQAGRTLRKLFT